MYEDIEEEIQTKVEVSDTYGYAIGDYYEAEDEVELKTIRVQRTFRNQGHGRILLAKFIGMCWSEVMASKITLEVEPTDQQGLSESQLYRFYESFGFRRTHSNRMELIYGG